MSKKAFRIKTTPVEYKQAWELFVKHTGSTQSLNDYIKEWQAFYKSEEFHKFLKQQ